MGASAAARRWRCSPHGNGKMHAHQNASMSSSARPPAAITAEIDGKATNTRRKTTRRSSISSILRWLPKAAPLPQSHRHRESALGAFRRSPARASQEDLAYCLEASRSWPTTRSAPPQHERRRAAAAGAGCARRLMSVRPAHLLVDEPSVGLAPRLGAAPLENIKELKDSYHLKRAHGRAGLHPGDQASPTAPTSSSTARPPSIPLRRRTQHTADPQVISPLASRAPTRSPAVRQRCTCNRIARTEQERLNARHKAGSGGLLVAVGGAPPLRPEALAEVTLASPPPSHIVCRPSACQCPTFLRSL